MSTLYLQNIVESIQWDNLPYEWLDFDFVRFSDKKILYEYQQQALKNALKLLYKYYNDFDGDKKQFYGLYKDNGLTENIIFNLKNNSKIKKIFQEFSKDYVIQDDKIEGYHFINRMSFWMATGSGKTLVIVKLIELLQSLINKSLIPQKDILFLTYREDLLEQFKKHIIEFSQGNNSFSINLYNLKDYENVKRENKLKFSNEINVFYYRSDLISDEQKDKIVNFRNYDNNGNWYILFDEAHKGDREDSKRQQFYSILSRNGFLFNFSATFTDDLDFVTCVFNFNLEQFIRNGFGKQIYISHNDIEDINSKEDFNDSQKQIIILKILLLYTYINEQKIKVGDKYYHKPLLLTLVNSVNTEDSDLEMFFKELSNIANNGKDNLDILSEAKKELKKDLEYLYEFTNEKIQIDFNLINNYNYSDIIKNIFNSDKLGKIEILKIPNNNQEIILKLKTSDKPFGLIKIGDISEWIKNKLSDCEINETLDNESVFKKINQNDSDITILMGSRSFYEGWDSNRPNIILYINIGKGTDARKFVLQSIGRGVRIEPIPNKRKRLQFLINNNEVLIENFNQMKHYIPALETLFVYGTKADNLKEVIETLKEEKQEELLGDLFEVNPDVEGKSLYIPVYKESDKIIVEERDILKFKIHSKDYQSVKKYFNYLGEKIYLVKYDCDLRVLNKIKEGFNGKCNDYFILSNEESEIKNLEFLLKKIFNYFVNKVKELNIFKKLQEEIIHFKRITISKEKLNSLREKIEKVKNVRNQDKLKRELQEKLKKNEISLDDYTKQIENISTTFIKETEAIYSSNEKLKIKFLANHYYLPVALAESEKVDFIQHIIKHKSEIDFINDLEKYLEKEDNFFKQCDWWFFSKIDETLDEVYIPYYQPKTNRIERFKPDFIFWLKKDNNYIILFIDPKGTEYTDAYRKIEGYKRIFEDKKFNFNNLTLDVKLFLKTKDISNVLECMKQYWFDEIHSIINTIR